MQMQMRSLRARALRARPSAPVTRPIVVVKAAAATELKSVTQFNFPFSRIQGQEEMKLALLLSVVDPNIGGVLVMGDRGTGKSVAVS